jgi:hypothetical protein
MVLYLFTNIDCASLYDFSLGCWNCSDTVVLFLFSLLPYIDQTSRRLYTILFISRYQLPRPGLTFRQNKHVLWASRGKRAPPKSDHKVIHLIRQKTYQKSKKQLRKNDKVVHMYLNNYICCLHCNG